MEQNNNTAAFDVTAQDTVISPVTKEDLWYVDNYMVLRDYYDRTIHVLPPVVSEWAILLWKNILFITTFWTCLKKFAIQEIIFCHAKSFIRMLSVRLPAA